MFVSDLNLSGSLSKFRHTLLVMKSTLCFCIDIKLMRFSWHAHQLETLWNFNFLNPSPFVVTNLRKIHQQVLKLSYYCNGILLNWSSNFAHCTLLLLIQESFSLSIGFCYNYIMLWLSLVGVNYSKYSGVMKPSIVMYCELIKAWKSIKVH